MRRAAFRVHLYRKLEPTASFDASEARNQVWVVWSFVMGILAFSGILIVAAYIELHELEVACGTFVALGLIAFGFPILYYWLFRLLPLGAKRIPVDLQISRAEASKHGSLWKVLGR